MILPMGVNFIWKKWRQFMKLCLRDCELKSAATSRANHAACS